MLVTSSVAAVAVAIAMATAPAVAIKCEVTNWNDFKPQISAGNFLIQFAEDTNLLSKIAAKFDPLTLNNVNLPQEKTNLLGTEWTFDSRIDFISISGLKTIDIKPVNVTAPTQLQLGGSMGTLKVNRIDVSVNATRPSSKVLGKTVCWTQWDFWKACTPKSIKLRTAMELLDASVSATADVQVMRCGGSWFDKLLCRVQSGWDFVKSLFQDQLKNELLQRIKAASVVAVDVKFANIKQLDVDILDAGKLENAVVDFAVAIAKKATQKFGFIQAQVERIASALGKRFANDEIEQQFKPFFQASCT
ncbi:hypothetical protein HDU96_010138 [Phlyctochytrium bullatum]|nr:hypothetical protein HDU96_010138 [Phlyctochytrium bullatum]